MVGGKGIKSLGYCEVIKPAIIFCDCKKAIKCILRVHYNDKRFHFVTAKKQLSVICECTEKIFCCVPNTRVGSRAHSNNRIKTENDQIRESTIFFSIFVETNIFFCNFVRVF